MGHMVMPPFSSTVIAGATALCPVDLGGALHGLCSSAIVGMPFPHLPHKTGPSPPWDDAWQHNGFRHAIKPAPSASGSHVFGGNRWSWEAAVVRDFSDQCTGASLPADTVTSAASHAGALEAEPPLLSIGSVGHLNRSCRPCHYIHSNCGCRNGYACEFCHEQHSKRSRPRLPKALRLKCRALSQSIFDAEVAGNEHQRNAEMQHIKQPCSHKRLAAYATAVLRSLRGGAILQNSCFPSPCSKYGPRSNDVVDKKVHSLTYSAFKNGALKSS